MVGVGMNVRQRLARAAVAAWAGAALLAATGCDLRRETPPPVFASPDAVTASRDSLASSEAAVAEAAATAGSDADAIATGAAAAALAHVDALGGVYVAYPGQSPTPHPVPSPSATPAPEPTLAEAISATRATAETIATTSDDPNLAALARSIDLEWALREAWAAHVIASAAEEAAAADAAAQASATPAPVATPAPSASPGAPEPSDADPVFFPRANGSTDAAAGFVPERSSSLTQDQLRALALAEDEARFTYETEAAQEFAQRRDAALARSRLHGARSDALATLLNTDPRTPLYQLRDADLLNPDSRRALELSLETDLAARYAALLEGASADDASWVLNACFDAYARAMRTEGFTAANLPTLPGLRLTPAAGPASSPSASASPSASLSAG